MPRDSWLRENQKIRMRQLVAQSAAGKHLANAAKMPFGMHKGKPLSDIPTDYLEWLLDEANLQGSLRQQVLIEVNTRGQSQ